MIDLKLETAEQKYGHDVYHPHTGTKIATLPPDRIAESVVLRHWAPSFRAGMPVPEHTLLSPAVHARAEHGRWLVDCPFCASAQVTSPNDKRFFCVECSNAGAGGWLRVVWPKDVHDIEAVLVLRHPINQIWNVGQTVADLERENAEHGLGSTSVPRDGIADAFAPFAVTQAQQAAIRSALDAGRVQHEASVQGEDPLVLTARSEIAPPPPALPDEVAGQPVPKIEPVE